MELLCLLVSCACILDYSNIYCTVKPQALIFLLYMILMAYIIIVTVIGLHRYPKLSCSSSTTTSSIWCWSQQAKFSRDTMSTTSSKFWLLANLMFLALLVQRCSKISLDRGSSTQSTFGAGKFWPSEAYTV